MLRPDGRQVELQHPLVFGVLQAVGPEAGFLGVGLHQFDLLVLAAGELEVVQGLLVDVEQRGGGAIFRRHVGDGGTVAHGQRRGAFAVELQIGGDDPLLAQELGQRQHDIGGGDARLGFAGQFDADDIGQTDVGRTAQHHVLGFQAAHAHGDHAQGVHMGRVAVGADAGVGEGHAVAGLHHRRHLLQIDLVHDAVAGRDDVHVLERLLGPVDEVEAVLVAAILDGAVLGEGVGIVAAAFHGQGVVDDQLGGDHRVDLGRVAALVGDGVAQAGQIHQGGLAQDVVADHAGGVPGKIQVALALDDLLQGIGQGRRIAAAHQVLRQHAGGVGELVVGSRLNGLDRGASVEIVELRARQGLAVLLVHGVSNPTWWPWSVYGLGLIGPPLPRPLSRQGRGGTLLPRLGRSVPSPLAGEGQGEGDRSILSRAARWPAPGADPGRRSRRWGG